MEIIKYRNPWYTRQMFQPEYYFAKDNEKPMEYKSFYIFQHSNPWIDVVEHVIYPDGTEEFICVTQRGSVKNAKKWIDSQEEV